ncbi:hypothetical protein ACFQZJ_02955 [Maribacter chungangensis]|uniref:Uncharacterized protein n=1 Tax=Maribacter chungangensis TaxID=1069117 RepID=A0ABW3AZU5_9FLAO
MQKKNMLKSVMASAVVCLFLSACSNDEGSIFETPIPDSENPGEPDPGPEVATIIFNAEDPNLNEPSAEASGEVGATIPGRVVFTSAETKQRRLYITQNVGGAGDMPFNDFDLESADLRKALKADGSVDLDGATRNAVDFTFELPVPALDNGEIVYSFWTTSGKGDFRDPEKRQLLGVGTITVTVGNGTNPAAQVRSFEGIQLFAPAADGTTRSFFSLLDETVYRINEGPEFRAFWDFGYYFGASGVSAGEEASFASTAQFNDSFGFPVAGLEPTSEEPDAENETLNEGFFMASELDEAAFEGVTLAGDLANIQASDSQKINNLAVGDVIEFVDNYGKKGLILITDIEEGFNNNDFIEFDVKIQP